MSNFTVTTLGAKNLISTIQLTAKVIELTDGSLDVAWTMQALHRGQKPIDDEGWAPWAHSGVQDLIARGYIEEVTDASGTHM